MISDMPPGTVWPPALIDPICTWASSEGRSCSVIDAVMETLARSARRPWRWPAGCIVPVKELAPLVVFAAA